jgi:hypothetical protein
VGILLGLVLDIANILGGLLLAAPLLARLPNVGAAIERFAARLSPYGWVIGIAALVAGGYFLVVHLFGGYILHFEVVGIVVGLLLAGERLTGRRLFRSGLTPAVEGPGLWICIFGIIAILVGLEGLVTPG